MFSLKAFTHPVQFKKKIYFSNCLLDMTVFTQNTNITLWKKRPFVQVRRFVSHNKTHNSLHKCICLAYGSGVEPVHITVCRTEAIPANGSRVSRVGRALGNDSLISWYNRYMYWADKQTKLEEWRSSTINRSPLVPLTAYLSVHLCRGPRFCLRLSAPARWNENTKAPD